MRGPSRWTALVASLGLADHAQGVGEYAVGIIGLPGVGKSTVAALLGQGGTMTVRATSQFHDPNSRMTRLIARLLVDRDKSVALACQIEGLARRASLCLEADHCSIVDEPLESVLAHSMALFELGILAPDEAASWIRMFDVVQRCVPQPRRLAYLTCPRPVLLDRVVVRGRPRDLGVSAEYLDALEVALEDLAGSALATGIEVVRVDTGSMQPDEVAAELVRGLPSLAAGQV